jgi:hypothetical protein
VPIPSLPIEDAKLRLQLGTSAGTAHYKNALKNLRNLRNLRKLAFQLNALMIGKAVQETCWIAFSHYIARKGFG